MSLARKMLGDESLQRRSYMLAHGTGTPQNRVTDHRIGENFNLDRVIEQGDLDDVVRAHEAMDFSKSNSGAVQATQNTDQLIIHTFFVGFSLDL